MMLKFLSAAIIVLLVSCTPKESKEPSPPAVPTAEIITPERNAAGDAPRFVIDALESAPPDTLVGIGNAKMSSPAMARTTAATRARADISRQINSVTEVIVRNYAAANKIDDSQSELFRETIKLEISTADLAGVSVAAEDIDEAGNYWVVVTMDKSALAGRLNEAGNAAKDAAPAMDSFDAETLINTAIP